jgi:hypothetical protein
MSRIRGQPLLSRRRSTGSRERSLRSVSRTGSIRLKRPRRAYEAVLACSAGPHVLSCPPSITGARHVWC